MWKDVPACLFVYFLTNRRSKMKTKAMYIYATLICALLCSTLAFADANSKTMQLAKTPKDKNPLLVVARKNGSIGIIPYYVIKGKVYVLLGQELTGGKLEKSGTFSNFGGSIKPNGNTVLQHMLYEFHKETLGQMRLNEEYVLNNSFLLYNKSAKDKDTYFIFVKFSEQQYNKTKKFNVATVRLNAYSPPNSHFEKEAYAWVSLEDLLQQAMPSPKETSKELASLTKATESAAAEPAKDAMQTTGPDTLPLPSASDMQRFTVQTPQGDSMSILIRSYFLHDCLQDPKLPSLIKQFTK